MTNPLVKPPLSPGPTHHGLIPFLKKHIPHDTCLPEVQHAANMCARLTLIAFVLTFILARILVIFIMAGKLPAGLFFHVEGTHVHHLNYGIFLMSATNAYLLFFHPAGRKLYTTAAVFGIGLALTFDEFGMWLHLGGPYWQRASFDAIVVVGAVLALIAYGSQICHWRPHHHITIAALLVALGLFGWVLNWSVTWFGSSVAPLLTKLEQGGPT